MRVYWEDTDGGGVVYYARYLNYFERARTEWLRSLGIDQSRLIAEHDIVFVVRRVEVDFHQPARLDDELRVSARPVKLGASRVCFAQGIKRAADGVELVRAQVDTACLAAGTFKAVRIPAWLRAKIAINEE
jgi:acyl-CoA thioester hydrolase